MSPGMEFSPQGWGRTLCSMDPLPSLAQFCSKAQSQSMGTQQHCWVGTSPSPRGVYYRPVGIFSWKHHFLVLSLEAAVLGPAG